MNHSSENTSLVEIAKKWMIDTYDEYPDGIRGFSSRSISPTPTVILESTINPDLLEDVLQTHGYDVKRKQSQDGRELIAACHDGIDEQKNIVYTFEESEEVSLDSPVRHDDPPADGRVEIITSYLKRASAP